MNLFTYLLAKNDKFSLVHKGDLFSYLLGKNNSIPLKTAEGDFITIEALKTKINELKMSKESTQETTEGKNKLAYPNFSDVTVGNITFKNNKGIYTISTNGTSTTPTSTSIYAISNYVIQEGDYIHFNNNFIDSHIGISLNFSDNTNYFSSFAVSTNKIISLNNYVGKTITGINFNWNSGYTFNGTFAPMICNTSTTTDFEEYTGGQASPNPSYPQEVKTVKGYRNLFDISNIKSINGGGTWNNNEYSLFGITFTINNDGSIKINGTSTNDAYINLYSSTTSNLINDSNKTYNFSKGINNTNISLAIYEYISTWSTKANTTDKSVQYTPSGNQTGQIFRITIGNNKTINNVTIYPMLTEGTEALPYVPYGNNYVAITNTNGTDTNYYTIPLNGNEIAGIGDYKDELIVDRNGHCWLNKKIGKIVLDENSTGITIVRAKENSTYFDYLTTIFKYTAANKIPIGLCNYLEGNTANQLYSTDNQGFTFTSSTGRVRFNLLNTIASTINALSTWLSTHNLIVYGALEESNLIDLNYNVDLRLFKGVNNISNSDDMNMTLIYK